MSRRVPVLGQDHVAENTAQAVDDGNGLITAGDGQRTAVTEIILNIDDDQGVLLGRVDNDSGPFGQGVSNQSALRQRSLKASETPPRKRISMHWPLRFSMKRQAR